ncbi:MAG: hypothetical protein AB7G39_03585 [Alphaproteobacteria bacterium]
MARQRFVPRRLGDAGGIPFDCAEDAWRWAHAGRTAQIEGARFTAGLADTPRPCEPGDVLGVAQRLHRSGRIEIEHLSELVRCGRDDAARPPSPEQQRRRKRLWSEAMDRLTGPLVAKGIVIRNNENKT